MRVLLHTPLKPPDSPTPSGDREMARGLARLLRRLGHRTVMPPLSRVAAGVPSPQAHLALERRARAQAARLIARWRALPASHPERFDLWLTYHCYYRKPDWLGPIVSRALGVPYVLVEASHAPRRAYGPPRLGHRAVERALAAADLVLTVNPHDLAGVRARLRPGARQVRLPPFIDTAPFRTAPQAPNDPPVLLSVGMMRTRDKLESYKVLARAFALLRHSSTPSATRGCWGRWLALGAGSLPAPLCSQWPSRQAAPAWWRTGSLLLAWSGARACSRTLWRLLPLLGEALPQAMLLAPMPARCRCCSATGSWGWWLCQPGMACGTMPSM